MRLYSISHGQTLPIMEAIKLIEYAKKSIVLSTYYLEGQGVSGKCLMNSLITTKALKIQILTNHCFLDNSKTYQYLTLVASCNQNIELRVWKHTLMNSNHAKFIIIDNEFICIGGFNFQDPNFRANWSDLGLILKSKSYAIFLLKHFEYMWLQSTMIKFDIKHKLQNELICPSIYLGDKLYLNQVKIKKYNMLSKKPNHWFRHSNKSESFLKLLQVLNMATKEINILCPNVIDKCVWNVLTEKLKNNVKVNILTNLNQNSIQSQFTLLQKEQFFLCAKSHQNLHIKHCNLSHDKVKINNDMYPVDIDHSKYFDVDLKHFYIGSFNLDPMSNHACSEIGLIIYDEPKLTFDINKFLFQSCWLKAKDYLCNLQN